MKLLHLLVKEVVHFHLPRFEIRLKQPRVLKPELIGTVTCTGGQWVWSDSRQVVPGFISRDDAIMSLFTTATLANLEFHFPLLWFPWHGQDDWEIGRA